jgi:hypothetical protein
MTHENLMIEILKREKDVDTGDMHYQRSKCNDKESDDSVQGQEDGTIKGR